MTTTTFSTVALAFLEPEKLSNLHYERLFGQPRDPLDPQALEKEYARLFLATQEKNISLYASAWLSTQNLLHQAPLLEIQTIYHQNGLTVPPGSVEADHLGILLLFIDLLQKNQEEEFARAFAKKYVLAWLPEMLTRVKEKGSIFYAPLLGDIIDQLTQ